MPVLGVGEVADLRLAIGRMGDRALRQVLYGAIDVLKEHVSLKTALFMELVEDGKKLSEVLERRE